MSKKTLKEKLLSSGAILFRGFPLPKADAFDFFVKAFDSLGFEDLPYERSLSFAVRLPVTGRVCTTNEGKTGGMRSGEVPATEGGATAICPSYIVYERLKEKYPEFIDDCEKKGVKYSAILKEHADPSIGVGRSWKSFFGRETKEEVEHRMRELGYTWVWLDNNTLKWTTPLLPAVREIPGSGVKVFFNQMIAQIVNARDFAARESNEDNSPASLLGDFLTFGDGSSVPVEPLHFAHRVSEETAVEIAWQQGDVALLDNYAVMHARRAYEGNRRVLASLVQ